jgi:hypothetical protein
MQNLHAVYEVMVGGVDMDEVTVWADNFDLYNSTLRAKDEATLDALESRECTYLVETATMQVTWRSCTGTSGAPPYSIGEGLAELDAALNP